MVAVILLVAVFLLALSLCSIRVAVFLLALFLCSRRVAVFLRAMSLCRWVVVFLLASPLCSSNRRVAVLVVLAASMASTIRSSRGRIRLPSLCHMVLCQVAIRRNASLKLSGE